MKSAGDVDGNATIVAERARGNRALLYATASSGAARCDRLEQVADRHAEGLCDPHQHVGAGFALRELDATEMLVCDAGGVSDRSLSESLIEADLLDLCSKQSQQVWTRARRFSARALCRWSSRHT